jgi:RNA polymerase sigma factor (sigma-70 family)
VNEPSAQPASEPPLHPDDTRARVLLHLLHEARRRGDRGVAEQAWQQIVLAEIERVRGLVVTFRYDELPGGRIADADADEVVHEVFLQLHRRIELLRGHGVGELRSVLRTATTYACLEHVDRTVQGEQRGAGSLDAGADDHGAIARGLLDRLAAEYADEDSAELAGAMIHPALAEVDDDTRAVLVMTEAGFAPAEIGERLGLSRDAVDQRRARGFAQLREAIREQAEEDLAG